MQKVYLENSMSMRPVSYSRSHCLIPISQCSVALYSHVSSPRRLPSPTQPPQRHTQRPQFPETPHGNGISVQCHQTHLPSLQVLPCMCLYLLEQARPFLISQRTTVTPARLGWHYSVSRNGLGPQMCSYPLYGNQNRTTQSALLGHSQRGWIRCLSGHRSDGNRTHW